MLLAFDTRELDGVSVPTFFLHTLPSHVTAASYNSLQNVVTVNVGSDHGVKNRNICAAGSNGERHCMEAPEREVASSFPLETWTLTMEHWEAPDDLNDIATVARRRNTSHTLTAVLRSWTGLDASLHDASAIGYYKTSFTWPLSSGAADGAYLCLDAVVHAVNLYVNRNPVPALDQTAPKIDVLPFLYTDRNDGLAVVPLTTWNYVRSLLPHLRIADLLVFYAPQYRVPVPIPEPSTNGLIGDVTIKPYWQYAVKEYSVYSRKKQISWASNSGRGFPIQWSGSLQ